MSALRSRARSGRIAASLLAALSLGVSKQALAQTCGALDASGSATCTTVGNPYVGGINYSTNNTPIHVTLAPGVQVIIPAGSGITDSVNLANTTGAIAIPGADASLTADSAFIDNTANSSAANKSGLRIQASGNATITATNTEVRVTGTQSTNAIWAIVLPSSDPNTVARVVYNGPGVTSIGTAFSTVIQADNRGTGSAIIDAGGNITGIALGSAATGITGLFVVGGSSGTVNYSSGAIDVRGNFANGIYANGDSATVTTSPGTTITVRSLTGERLKPGIALDSFGSAADNHMLVAAVASTIQMSGPAAPDPALRNNGYGIRAYSFLDAPISVNYTGPGITTEGGNGMGIVALSGGGSITVTSSGPITTSGSGAVGIFADSTNLIASSPSEFRASPVFTGTPIGTVQVNATNVLTTGQFSSGIVATGPRDVTVTIAPGGLVSGGWQADLTGGSSLFGLPAAGVILNSSGGTATLINDGSIGALSDRALFGDPQVINNGTIIGFVQFVDGDNSILNNGTFNLRHFADTNGDGVRDTLRVAIADLGTGLNNTFVNNGTLALPQAAGATTLDTTGQYLPLGNPNNTMVLGGALQGQLIGVITFTNSGTIDLQSNLSTGDVLLVTGGRQTGVPGPGTFVSNGGILRLDTVLNQGGPATFSDTLVVDGTSVGANGATRTLIRNVGGKGALTVGDGILVVQVLDAGRSASGAFQLGSPVVAGPFEYTLFQGGINGSNPGSWFLRSTLNCALPNAPSPPCPPTPIPPDPQPPEPEPVPPNFRPETSLYAAVPAMSLLYGRNLLDTFHERVGEPLDRSGGFDGNFGNGAWGRIIGMHGQRDTGNAGIFGRGPKYTYDFIGLQLGHNIYRREDSDGSHDHAGLYGAFGFARGRVKHFDGTHGDSDFRAYSLGAYWTHFGPSGWYLDGIVQGTYYDVTSDAHRGIPKLKTDGFGIAASAEGGYPLRLANDFFIEPQAQLVYQYIDLADGRDVGATVRFSNVNSLAGRVGARIGRTWTWEGDGGGTRKLTAWLRPNVWHEFLGNPKTSFSSDNGFLPFRADLGGTWFEINAGVSGQIGRSTSLFANVSWQTRFNGNSYAYNGKIGLRYNW